MWLPDIGDEQGSVFRRVLTRMERDIRNGVLGPGERLPPQRDLAFRLGVSTGAVTRAYTEAERRGLVRGHVGRGTFVATPGESTGPFALVTAPDSGIVDLARNRPPSDPAAAMLAETLVRLGRAPGAQDLLDYPPPAGFEHHRRAIAGWLREATGAPLEDWRRMILCCGAQQAMALAFSVVCRPGDAVMCEAATFQGMKALADFAGYRLLGLAMDGEGVLPEHLDATLGSGAAKVFYTMPTLQNPTGRTMGPGRRADIVAVCRKHDAWIVEDDIYAGYADTPGELPSLASLAPERSLYINGASKILAPGLRLGVLQLPSEALLEHGLRSVRAGNYAPSSFGAQVMSDWIARGAASAVLDELRQEMAARTELALRILGAAAEAPASSRSLHIWMPMSELDAERVAGRALRAGVEVTPPSAPSPAGCEVQGVRVCLGAPPQRSVLERALHTVKASLSAEVGDRPGSVI